MGGRCGDLDLELDNKQDHDATERKISIWYLGRRMCT